MIFERMTKMIGQDNYKILQCSSVCIFGLGGVGSYTAEILARSGIKKLTIVDFDKVSETNINRQLIALHSTINLAKTDVLEARLKDINPNIIINKYQLFINEETINDVDFSDCSYICDCVDNIEAKIAIVKKAKDNNIKIISSMGTGNKLDPMQFKIKDINQTKVCPLAKKMRSELKKLNIKDVLCLYSEELPYKSNIIENNKVVPMSIAFVPSVAGILIARHVILDLIKLEE